MIEFPPVLDGFTNTFEINFGKKINLIEGSNLWWFLNNYNVEGYKKHKKFTPNNAISLLQFHKEICDFLTENNIENKYLNLRFE